jgi:4-aminobutyrate aminotransferase
LQKIFRGHYTHEKSPVGSAAALATISFIETNNLLQKVADDEKWMQTKLLRIKEKFPLIGDVRGIGLLWGIELVIDQVTKVKAFEEAEKIMYDCMLYGLSFKVSQGNVLQLSPSLTISREDLQTAMSILSFVFEKHS